MVKYSRFKVKGSKQSKAYTLKTPKPHTLKEAKKAYTFWYGSGTTVKPIRRK